MKTTAGHPDSCESLEVDLFVEALRRVGGYDFSQYQRPSLLRRVVSLRDSTEARSITELTARVIHEPGFVQQAVAHLSVTVSEMFRHPNSFKALITEVFPVLATWPRFNVWQAGCAHGQEAYSLAILLEEAGLAERARIFATDFNEAALTLARHGRYPLKEARVYSESYLRAGGQDSFASYYTASAQHICLHPRLQQRITFAHHNLAADAVFTEAALVLCRNVLIYFAPALQNRALGLFRDSLVRGGFLCLGIRESLEHTDDMAYYARVSRQEPIYRRLAEPAGSRADTGFSRAH